MLKRKIHFYLIINLKLNLRSIVLIKRQLLLLLLLKTLLQKRFIHKKSRENYKFR